MRDLKKIRFEDENRAGITSAAAGREGQQVIHCKIYIQRLMIQIEFWYRIVSNENI